MINFLAHTTFRSHQ